MVFFFFAPIIFVQLAMVIALFCFAYSDSLHRLSISVLGRKEDEIEEVEAYLSNSS